MKRAEGSVSVFLALTITLALSFCMVLIESARENTMLLKADVIFDTGAQCLLAEYHQVLWEDYDLFYIDSSYGTDMPDYELVKQHLKGYIDRNLGYDNGGWLGLWYEGAVIFDVALATDFGGKDFYMQAVEAAEASVGIPYIEQILGWLNQVESVQDIGQSMTEQKKEAGHAIADADGTEVLVKEAVWGQKADGTPVLLEEAEYETVDIDNPLEQIASANVLLRQIVPDYTKVSTVKVNTSALASHRELAAGSMAENNADDSVWNSMWNKSLFCKYVLDHFAAYTDMKAGASEVNDLDETDFYEEQGKLQYELEYLIGGMNADAQNMEVVVAELLAIREIDNYLLLLQDETKQLEAHSIATVAAALVPWLEPVVAQALLLYWAYEDSIADLQTLLNGGEVALVKSVPLDAMANFTLGYEEYLIILILLQSRETLTMRAMDLIELSVRQKQSAFRMDGCISQAYLLGSFQDNYCKEYTISKKLVYY